MADSKVSDLTTATSIGGSEYLYLVQSNTSKKVTAATLYSNAANVTLSGSINIGGTPQILSAAGVISLSTPITHLTTDTTDGVLSLPAGTDGQIKYIMLVSSSGGTYTINSSNVGHSANVVFDKVGKTATLMYTNNRWYVVGGTANVTYL